MCPSTVARASKPVRCSISRSSRWPIPPRRAWPNSSAAPSTVSIVPSLGTAPSATTTIEKKRPREWRRRISRTTSSMSKGRSGIRITSAPPARPEWSAIQPGVAAHHLDDHHAVVRLGRGVEAVDGLGGDLHGRVEAECHVGAAEVVVDRLRHAQHRQAVVAVQPGGGAQRVLAADRDQPVEVEGGEVLPDPLGAAVAREGVGARAAQDRAAAGEDAARGLDRQLLVGVLERPPPPVAKADDRVPVTVDPLAHDRSDHGVQAGAVAPSGQHADSHGRDDNCRRQNPRFGIKCTKARRPLLSRRRFRAGRLPRSWRRP